MKIELILITAGGDAEDHIFPYVFAIVASDNKERELVLVFKYNIQNIRFNLVIYVHHL